jgi:hypothetical protein
MTSLERQELMTAEACGELELVARFDGPMPTRVTGRTAYADVRNAQSRSWAESPRDPTATRRAILKVVDADKPPLRIFFVKAPLDVATKDYESRLAKWNQWQPVSVEAYGA